MQLKPRDIPSFLKNPSAYRAILIYGPDEGLVRSRKSGILKTLGVARDDPFGFNEYDIGQIADEPSLLYEGLSAMSLTGDAPCIAITSAGDKLTAHVKDALKEITQSNMLIITGGDLPKRSTLRSYFENAKAKDIAAIPCYRDEGASLAQVVRSFLQAKQIQTSQPVISSLCSLLGNDRAVTLSELEKLDLYLGKQRNLSEDDVLAVLNDNQHRLGSDAAMAFFTGNMSGFFTLTENAFLAGENAIAMVRIVLRIARQLLEAKTMQQQSSLSPASAIDGLRPFVFFRDKPHYIKALSRYSLDELMVLIDQLGALETACKRGVLPPELLFTHQLVHAS